MSGEDVARTGAQPNATGRDRTVGARMAEGRRCLQAIGGPDYDGPLKKVAAVSPDMADLLLAFPYGDVMSRPGLSLRHRQICTIAMLLAHRSAQAQLRFHMRGLLNVGGSIDDLVELLVIASGLLGFPPAIAGVPIIRDLIAEQGIAYVPAEHQPAGAEERFDRGAQAFRTLLHVEPEAYAAAFAGISPALAQWTVEFEFGDVLSRSGLDTASRHLASLMMLAMRGNSEDRLLLHLRGALADDVPRTAIVEALIQLAVYGGFPTALTAFGIAAEAFAGPAAPAHDAPAAVAIGRAEPFDRAARGLATLNATSAGAGDAVVKSFAGVAPDIGAMIVDHAYGDIFARPGLDPKTRELTACAALAAMGAVDEGPLGVHVSAARTLGATEAEIIETILNTAPYAGYPAAQQAIVVAHAAMRSADDK
ncbi:carboxymuconolactone decarboxylase family protein [uncultured Sphingomonas sp.]|uniref:carboxymuconolactone decarboxylase family protein n=1 Tax=uncultured Sphingomonas sp. TaxID=158754 RepID=UPI0035CBF7CC